MNTALAYNTVNPSLLSVLTDVMSEDLFDDFILVGGTALSLRLGHRISVDIDMFTAVEYGSIDFSFGFAQKTRAVNPVGRRFYSS